ncbi:MAG: 3-mercaptopyruvate sulfurtransferase [Hyphomonadaceae bacterium]
MTLPSPLVDAKWLIENMAAPDLRVVDATWFAPFTSPPETGRQAYMRAHIPEAVYFDIDEIADPDSDFAHMLPSPIVFASKVRKLGLGDGNRLVVYDQNNFFAAARVWWMFRTMGFTDVLVLDGGLQAWRDVGGLTDDIPPVAVERHITPRVRGDLIKTKEQIAAQIGNQHARIVDARPAGRFTGEAPEPRKGLPSGHIPGSVNIAGSEFTENGYMKSTDALAEVFAMQGIDPMEPIIATCGSGVTAAITALALATLGNDHVAVYDGSWTEWASDGTLPIETGA